MPSTNRVAANTIILYGRLVVTVFISLYSTRLILGSLGTGDYGIFNVVGGAISMLTFLNTAMTFVSQRFMSFSQGEGNFERQREIFNISVVLHFAMGVIVILLLEIAGIFLFDSVLNIDPGRVFAAKLVYQFMVVSTFFTIISTPYDAIINAHENMMFVAVIGIIESLLKLGIAIFITYTSSDQLITYGLLTACMFVVLLLIRRVYCHKKYAEVSINVRKYFNRSLFKEMSGFATWTFISSASNMFTQYGQGILLNIFFGTTVNAAQGVSNQVSGQLGSLSSNMMKALNPSIVKSEGAGQREKMLKVSFAGSKISFYLLALFAIPIMIEMPVVFNFWLKSVPPFAIVFCRLLLLRNLIAQLFYPITTAISATGRIRGYQIGDSIVSFLPLPVSYLFFQMGYSPVVLYVIFILMVLTRNFGIVLYQAKIQCGLSIQNFLSDVVLRCFGIALISTAFALIPFYLMDEGLIRAAAVALVFFLTFFLLIYNIGLTKAEREKLLDSVTGVINKIAVFKSEFSIRRR